MSKKVRILSIDGGGIRGILPGTILTYIEEQLKKKDLDATIGKYFDFIAGTSTGGILSLLYLCPNDKGGYKYSAQEALDLYLNQGDEIFDISFKKKLTSLGGILDEKYSEKELEEALNDYLKDTKLSEILKPCLITSYDMRNRRAHFFTSHDAQDDIRNYYLKDVARATSAAPTYFEPARIKSLYGTPYALVDGGVFANNPTLCAYSEARTIDFSKQSNNKPDQPGAKDMIIVSLGTGTVKEPYHYKDFKDANKIKWIVPMLDIMMSGNSETVDYQLQQIYGTLDEQDQENYFRIQPELNYADNAMDNASLENLKALHHDGKLAVEAHLETLDQIVEKIYENS